MHPTTLFLLTGIASTTGFIVICSSIVLLFTFRKQNKLALVFLLTSLGLMVSTTLLKDLFQIARPIGGLIEVTSYAFPSGHASGVMFLGLTIGILSKTFATPVRYLIYVVILLIIFIIGVSRVVYGVHTPLQVFAGFLLGIFWSFVFFKFLEKIRTL